MMRTHIVTSLLLLPFGVSFTLVARADVVTEWNAAALEAIRAERTAPPAASRNLAMTHAAIYDAVNGIRRTYDPYHVKGFTSPGASPEAAASTAGHDTLVALHPGQRRTFDELQARLMAQIPAGSAKAQGTQWGASVARSVLAWRAKDGAADVFVYTPGSGPGLWQPTPPAFLPALMPQWPDMRPFAMKKGDQFRPGGSPGLHTSRYAADFEQVKMLGAESSSIRTAEQTEIALFWVDGPGTATPPGHWNQIAATVAATRNHSLEQNARLFVLLNVALADAAILCWDCKFTYELWRPVTAIREAATDGNPLTEPDASWTPLLVTPPFPEYTSGHSTFSAAAATVLGLFFGNAQTAFTTSSDALPTVFRSYSSFHEAALESGLSRIYGGIHFASGNDDGLASGHRLGAYVFENYFGTRKGHGRE